MPVRYSGGGGGGPAGPAGFTDAASFNIIAADSTAAPTDAATFAIALGLTDDVPVQTEALSLGTTWADENAAPTDSNSFTMKVWLSGSAGTGITNPGNADGQNNGTVATIETVVLGPTIIQMASALGANIPSGVAVTSVIYRGWFRSANTLVTSRGDLIMKSTSALFADVLMFRNVALATTIDHLGGTFTFDLIANGVDTLAKLQSCQMVHATADAAAGVTPHVMTVDSGCLEISAAFV